MKSKVIHFFTLFGSVSTLLCCALPALFVTLGMGATFAGLMGAVPQLVLFSKYKMTVFIFAGVMLTFAGFMQWQSRKLACPTDPNLREACEVTRPWSLYIYIFSLIIYLIGFFFAYAINWF